MSTGGPKHAKKTKSAKAVRRSDPTQSLQIAWPNGDIPVAASKPPAPAFRDRHRLYEASVQCPEADVLFFDRVYREWNGTLPRRLREDFCGTAAVAAEWVGVRPDNEAIGVDLHQPTLQWGIRQHIRPLGEAASRVTLMVADVRSVRRPRVDIVAAMNFSYFVFRTREELRGYFRGVRSSLAPGGLFVLDMFGGWESQTLAREKRRRSGFTYVWEQSAFDPITHATRYHIHFRFPDGTEMRRAFSYDWRFWTLPEVREVLEEAGFSRTMVYWEGTDRKTGKGNGVFRRADRARTDPGWIAYIVAGA